MCVNEECTIGLYDEGWDGGACVWEEMDLDILEDEFIKYVEKCDKNSNTIELHKFIYLMRFYNYCPHCGRLIKEFFDINEWWEKRLLKLMR